MYKLRPMEKKGLAQGYLSSIYVCLVHQLCLTVCNPMDCNLPGSSVHRILQARILEWVAISSSRGYSQPRDQTQVYLVYIIIL